MTRPDGREPEPAGPPPSEGRGSDLPRERRRPVAAPRRPGGGARRRTGGTLAFVESPVQLLNVLEWAHQDAASTTVSPGERRARRHGGRAGAGARTARRTETPRPRRTAPEPAHGLTIVVLSPHDPMTRGQLRRVAELARDEGIAVRWEEARGGPPRP